MDSFIFYNAETSPSNTLEVVVAKPKEIEKEKSSVYIQEISYDKEK